MQALRILAAVGAIRFVMAWASGQHWTTTPPRFPFTAPASSYSLTNALAGLQVSGAVSLAVPPGQTNSLFITRKQGQIAVVTNLTSPTVTTFLDLTANTFTVSEGGLTGLAFHPDYQQNGSFFVFYTRTNAGSGQMHNVISRFQTDPANPWRALTQSEQVLIAARDYNDTHQGGDLHFGPDGYLYASMGDGGGSWGQFTNAQRINLDLFSGILRLDVDGRPESIAPNPHPSVVGGYWIPADNPYIGANSFGGQAVTPESVRTEFWAVGLRNPFRISFDPVTGSLYAGDVGNNTVEEVNRIVAGGNYGWHRFEGTEQRASLPAGVTYMPPLYEYRHASQSTSNPEFLGDCVVGGIVYRGLRHPELYGKYVFGDYMSRHIWAMNPSGAGAVRLMTAGTPFVSFFTHPGTDEILVVERSGASVGRVSRLVRTTQSGSTPLPQTLSQTGVFTDLATLATPEGILPYEVNAPFWSDHAEKLRWFFLQDPESAIARDASDQWTFPTGAVWVKHFEMEMTRGDPATRKRLETRFLVKTADSVYGLTYRWRADGSNADLVGDAGLDETLQIQDGGVVRTQVWHYPGRSECLGCHNSTAGGVLGFSTRQLNRSVTVNGIPINQLTALGNLDVFSPPHGSPTGLPRLAAPTDSSASLEFRFRSYLDVNCAYCHLPDGLGRGNWDGRLSTPFAHAGILNGGVVDDLGIPDARVIAPGNLDASVLWQRVSALGPRHMPPLATSALNTAAIELVRHYTLWASQGSMRTVWQIGTDDPASVPASSRHLEFSMQNGAGNPVPGQVTRMPGDPEFPTHPTMNPGADDDFYFAGSYPPGFNGLTIGRSVPFDEPPIAFERGHTVGDRVNRIHFVLEPAHVGIGRAFRLTAEFASGGYSINDVIQSGFGDHDMTVRLRNANGNSVLLRSAQVSGPSTLVVEFTAAASGATAGANTIEISRTGPNLPNAAHWIRYDHVRIESIAESNFAPLLAQPVSQTVPEMAAYQSQLSATDPNGAAQTLTYALVSGPSGLSVSTSGMVQWTPTEAQGPGSYPVTVKVTDNGSPPLSDSRDFTLSVIEVNGNGVRTLWQIGKDDPASSSQSVHYEEFSSQNGLNDLRPGLVTRIPGDPVYEASPSGNPAADDDFYFAGAYPPGFNGLTTALSVSNDEPPAAWERGHTEGDRTNRVHFILSSQQIGSTHRFRLRGEFSSGGFNLNGVTQSGLGTHDMVIRFRNGAGVTTQVMSQTYTAPGSFSVEFHASTVSATAGANSLEIVRTTPSVTGVSSWIRYDFLRLENNAGGGFPPP